MASRFVGLPESAHFPASTFPQLTQVNQRPALAFDAATDEYAFWSDVAPQGLTGALTLIITYCMASATSGTVGLQAQVEAISDGDATDIDAGTSWSSANNSASTTVPGTAGYIDQVSITLSNDDGIAAGDLYRISVNRDADSSAITDNATGDLLLLSIELRDAA